MTTTPGDPHIRSVVLLVNMDGADASTTFTDESSLALTVTPSGNAQVDTAQAPPGCSSSLLLDGTGDFLTCTHTTQHEPGAAGVDWTFEAWFRVSAAKTTNTILNKRDTTGAENFSWSVNSSAGTMSFSAFSGTPVVTITSGAVISLDTWYHGAVVRRGSTWEMFLDGVSVGTGTQSGAAATNNQGLRIGRDGFNTARDFQGWIGPVRISRGVCRYTGTFEPPTGLFETYGVPHASVCRYSYIAPHTWDPHFNAVTSLFNWNGANGDGPTLVRDASRDPLLWVAIGTPFVSRTKWKYGVSSMRMSGANEGLNTASASGAEVMAKLGFHTGDQTIEAWINVDDAGKHAIVSALEGPTDRHFYFYRDTDDTLAFIAWNNATTVVALKGATTIPIDTWCHVAISRQGTTWRLFLNGVLEDSDTEAVAPTLWTGGGIRIGRHIDELGASYFTGYMDSFRATKFARYTGAFSVPNRSFPERGP